MVVEKKVFLHLKLILICYCYKKQCLRNISLRACSTRGMFMELSLENNATSSKKTLFPCL